MIPKEIHQIWFDFHTGRGPKMPAKYRRNAKKWRDAHPDFGYTLWDEKMALDLVETHYNWFLPTYLSMQNPIYRVDAIRYAIMHHIGGVYLDTDVEQRGKLHGLLHCGPAVVCKMPAVSRLIPFAVNNVPLLSEQGHPFWIHVLKSIERAAPYFAHRTHSPLSVLALAGPYMLTVCTKTYKPQGPGTELEVLEGEYFSPYKVDAATAVGAHKTDMTWYKGVDFFNDLVPIGLTVAAAWMVAKGVQTGRVV